MKLFQEKWSNVAVQMMRANQREEETESPPPDVVCVPRGGRDDDDNVAVVKPHQKTEYEGGRRRLVAGMPSSGRRDQLREAPSIVAGMLYGERRDHCSETETPSIASNAVYTDARRDVPSIVVNTMCQGAVSDVRGCVDGTEVCNDSYKPGTHQGDRGGDEVCNDRVYEPGNGDEGCSDITSLKTKPSEVSGGLKARISLWEMKIGGIVNEKERNHTRSTADRGSSRSNSTDRK